MGGTEAMDPAEKPSCSTPPATESTPTHPPSTPSPSEAPDTVVTDTESSPGSIDADADPGATEVVNQEPSSEREPTTDDASDSIEHGIATKNAQPEEHQRASEDVYGPHEAVSSRPPVWAERLFSETRQLRERVELGISIHAQALAQQRSDQERSDIARHNAACFREYSTSHLDLPLRPIIKKVPGIGAPIPQCQGNQESTELKVLVVGGEIPVFPKSPDELFHSWTLAQITCLGMLMNHDLGIHAGDDLRTCRLKTAFYLSNL